MLALVGAETIASNGGIGDPINQAEQFQQTNIVFCGVIIYAALGLSADLIVRAIEDSRCRGEQERRFDERHPRSTRRNLGGQH